MALTDAESAVLRELAETLRRDDARLADALGCVRRGDLPVAALLTGLVLVVGALVVLAVVEADLAAAVLAGTWAVLGPAALWAARRVHRSS